MKLATTRPIGIISERGAALVELSLVLPLMLIMTFAAFELGRVLSQWIWISQTAYNISVPTSETPDNPGARLEVATTRFQQLWNVENDGTIKSQNVLQSSVDTDGDGKLDSVEIQVVGNVVLTGIAKWLSGSLPAGATVYAPITYLDVATGSTFSGYSNPGSVYGCNGAVSGDSSPCASTDASHKLQESS